MSENEQRTAHILIAMPAYRGDCKMKTTWSIVALVQALSRLGVACSGRDINICDLPDARNVLAALFLQDTAYTHLLFVDNDMGFRPEAVTKKIRSGYDVIGCASPKRSMSAERLANLMAKQPRERALAMATEFNVQINHEKELKIEHGIAEDLLSIGMAVTLISRRALERMRETAKLSIRAHHPFSPLGVQGPLLGFFDRIDLNGRRLFEDESFCHRWRTECGGKIYAVIDEHIGHTGDTEFSARLIDALIKP